MGHDLHDGGSGGGDAADGEGGQADDLAACRRTDHRASDLFTGCSQLGLQFVQTGLYLAEMGRDLLQLGTVQRDDLQPGLANRFADTG
ncbi:hypothetical protein D3C81_1581860 [compost metagenome]